MRLSRHAAVLCAIAAVAAALAGGAPDGKAAILLPTVDLITVHDADGPGGADPAAPKVHEIDVLVAQAIDVDGNLAPTGVTLGDAAPAGYELVLRVSGSDERPVFDVRKARDAPATLPVSVELVADVSSPDGEPTGKKKTFGYDTLPSTAPGRFLANLDLREQDGDSDTEETQVDLEITDPGSSLAMITETYTPGESLTDRKKRSTTRLEYLDEGAGTQVPSAASVDLTAPAKGAGKTTVVLTRAEPTIAEFELAEPSDNPKLAGRIEQLPAAVTVVFDERNAGGVSQDDETFISYDGSEAVDRAVVSFEQILSETGFGNQAPADGPVAQSRSGGGETATESSGRESGPSSTNTGRAAFTGPQVAVPVFRHRQKITAELSDVPRHLELTHAPDAGTLNYSANGRLSEARVLIEDERPLFDRARWLEVVLENVPKALDANLGDPVGLDVVSEGEQIDVLELRALDSPATNAGLCELPCEDGVVQRDLPDRYSLAARIHNLEATSVDLDPDIDVMVDVAPDLVETLPCDPIEPGCGGGGGGELEPVFQRPFNIDLRKRSGQDPLQTIGARISRLFDEVRFDITQLENSKRIGYSDTGTGFGSGPDVEVDARNLDGLPEGENGVAATELHVDLDNLPRRLTATFGNEDGFPLRIRSRGDDDNILERAEVQISDGSETSLPATECAGSNCAEFRRLDGLLLRDRADEFVISGRLTALRDLFVARIGSPSLDFLHAELEANAFNDRERALRIDTLKDIETTVSGGETREGRERVKVTLDSLPREVELETISTPTVTIFDYDADRATDLFSQSSSTTYPNFPFSNESSSTTADPMPRSLRICRHDDGTLCSGETFFAERHRARGGSLALEASSPTAFRHFDDPAAGSAAFTLIELEGRRFVMENDSKESGSGGPEGGHFAIDTGWSAPSLGSEHEHPEAPAADQTTGVIKVVKSTRDITELVFPDGFAADSRVLKWSDNNALYTHSTAFPDTGDISIAGHVYCPNDMKLFLKRPAKGFKQNIAEGNDVEFDFAGPFCWGSGFPSPPGSDG